MECVCVCARLITEMLLYFTCLIQAQQYAIFSTQRSQSLIKEGRGLKKLKEKKREKKEKSIQIQAPYEKSKTNSIIYPNT